MTHPPTLPLPQARLALAARQGLGRTDARPLAEAVSAAGWLPAPSPATAPLALHARGAWPGRAAFAEALARGDLQLTPGPRGLPWIVPAADAPLARAFALADHASREARVASACNLTARDLAAARDAIRRALESPATGPELAARLDPATLRPLGAPGRRVGFSTVAGIVLRALWAQGEVARTVVTSRAGESRVVWGVDPHPRVVPSAAEAVDAVAARWLAAHAPISAREFAQAFGIAAGRAAAALKPLRPVELRVESVDDVLLAPADFAVPAEAPDAGPCFLPVGDPMVDARDRLSLLCDRSLAAAAELRHVGYAPLVVVAGEAVARWSYDLGRVTVRPLGASPVHVAPEAVAALEAFLAREVGIDAPLHGERPPRGAAALDGDVAPRG
ncbi:MAG: crosslink repair DNA glycosylase YcaQ family protein [Polyangiales bacterium]